MEDDRRRSHGSPPDRQPLEHRVQASPRARLLSIVRPRLLRILPAERRHRRRASAYLNCGMACQFNSSELAPLDDLGHYIQDALDLIEFANGSAATAWGASAPRWDIRRRST